MTPADFVPPRRRLSTGADNILIALLIACGASVSIGYFSRYPGWLSGNKSKPARCLVNKIAGAVVVYSADDGFSTDLNDLVAAKLVKAKQLRDPWAQPLYFRGGRAIGGIQICSTGEDKTFSDDDICSDPIEFDRLR